MTDKKPEALRLADALDRMSLSTKWDKQAAAELRRLHIVELTLQEQITTLTREVAALSDNALDDYREIERLTAEVKCEEQRFGDLLDDYASRLAFMLECMLVDSHGHWNEAAALLDEYKAEWEKVNPSPPTFMGEPIPPERRERLATAIRARKDTQ